jgi:hypothetical protein
MSTSTVIRAPTFYNDGTRHLPRVSQSVNLVLDDILLELGTDQDAVVVLSSAAVAADGEVTGIIEGTSDHLGHAANSLVISNITNDGDIHILVSKGGNSHTAFLADGSTGDTILNAPTGQSVDVYIAGAKEIDYATGAMAFQQATVLSTTSGALRLQGDDALTTMGADDDTAFHHRSTTLAADTVLTGVIVGSPKTFGTRANELLISNVVESGGIHFYATVLSNSWSAIHIDGAGGSLKLNHQVNGSIRLYSDTVEQYVFNATSADFKGNHIDNAGYLILNAVTLPAGTEVYAGHDNTGDLTLNAKSGKTINFAVAGTDEVTISATVMALGANAITMTGNLAATGARVSHAYTTSQTTTNAETVDSWAEVKDHIALYEGDALAVVNGMKVVEFTHEMQRDPSRRLKLGIDAESIKEPLATPHSDYGQGHGIGPRVDMGAVAALNSKAIQQLAKSIAKLEA